jgi:hypothetical protein
LAGGPLDLVGHENVVVLVVIAVAIVTRQTTEKLFLKRIASI